MTLRVDKVSVRSTRHCIIFSQATSNGFNVTQASNSLQQNDLVVVPIWCTLISSVVAIVKKCLHKRMSFCKRLYCNFINFLYTHEHFNAVIADL